MFSFRDTVGRMLTHLKFEVELAKDGAEAIELYQKAKESQHPFDAVMLDLTVPGGNSMAFAASLPNPMRSMN